MSGYAESIRNSIEMSKLSLSKICVLLHSKGFKTQKAYLSKLQNGKLPPAGDAMNKAIAEILGIDAIELQAAAYREKIPPEVLERIRTG